MSEGGEGCDITIGGCGDDSTLVNGEHHNS